MIDMPAHDDERHVCVVGIPGHMRGALLIAVVHISRAGDDLNVARTTGTVAHDDTVADGGRQ